MAEDKLIPEKPSFDISRAKTMLGKTILIGVTYFDHDSKFIEQKQMHGRIIRVDEKEGLAIELEGHNEGKTFRLPPDITSLRPAEPGKYFENSTGEVVINPDFIAAWEITRSRPKQ
jgi:hypothetical protein